MSGNRLHLDGLSELREALRNLPAHLTGEAAGIVVGAAEEAKAEIVSAYPEGPTGNLKAGVTVTRSPVASTYTTQAIVKSRAKHAHLFEFGSQLRYTKAGAGRGAMPPKPTFVPIAIRKRREMQAKLIDMLKRNGLVVSGG